MSVWRRVGYFFDRLLRLPEEEPGDRELREYLEKAQRLGPEAILEESLRKHLEHRFPPGPAPEVSIDWEQAPEGFTQWKHHAGKGVSVWLTGRYRDEEYGRVWENLPAPDFGATSTCEARMTPEEIALRTAKRKQARLEEVLEPGKPAEQPKPRF